MGDEGYPQRVWDKYSGEIDHEVAEYWRENYDLRSLRRLIPVQTPTGTYALVREVPRTFDRAITPHETLDAVDVERARVQHAAYCSALEDLGLVLVRVAADDRYPDCCFVEDTALVVGERAIVTVPGAEARRGETVAVEQALGDYKRIERIAAPATLDGGDVLCIGRRAYVGLSRRTNEPAVQQLRAILAGDGYEVVPTEVSGILHLKSACTYLGDESLAYLPGYLDDSHFSRFDRIIVPREESHAANCLSVNGTVLVPAGAPETRRRIEKAGFATREIDISEAHKVGGGLTCSSIIF